MYQFSLAYFIRIFSHCIEASGKSGDVAIRLQLLSDYATLFVFKNVSRCAAQAMANQQHTPWRPCVIVNGWHAGYDMSQQSGLCLCYVAWEHT